MLKTTNNNSISVVIFTIHTLNVLYLHEGNRQTADVHVDLKDETANLQQFPAVGLALQF